MYKLDLASVYKARVVPISKAGKPEALPPTSDALSLHTLRAHYQTLVWKQAHCLEPLLRNPVTMGWNRTDDNKLRPVLMTEDPIPKACVEITSCSCRTGCTTCKLQVVARRQGSKHQHQIKQLSRRVHHWRLILELRITTKNLYNYESDHDCGKRSSNRSADMNCSDATLLFFLFLFKRKHT